MKYDESLDFYDIPNIYEGDDASKKRALAIGTVPNSHGFREPHICDFPKEVHVGMVWTCPDCGRPWEVKVYNPEPISLMSVGFLAVNFSSEED